MLHQLWMCSGEGGGGGGGEGKGDQEKGVDRGGSRERGGGGSREEVPQGHLQY